MQPTISIDTQLSREQYLKAVFYMLYRQPATFVLVILGGLLIILGTLYFALFDVSNKITPYLFVGLGIFYIAYRPIMVYFNAKGLYNSNLRISEKINYTLDNEWIATKGESFEAKFTWAKLHKVVEIDTAFLLYATKITLHIIPKSDMTALQITDLRALVRSMPNLKAKLQA
jgi:hypothetical protein